MSHKTDQSFLSHKTEHPFLSHKTDHPFLSHKTDHPFHFLRRQINIRSCPTKTDHLFMPHKKLLSIHVPQTSHSFPNQRHCSWLPPVLALCSPGSRCRSASSCPHSPEIKVTLTPCIFTPCHTRMASFSCMHLSLCDVQTSNSTELLLLCISTHFGTVTPPKRQKLC